MILYLLYRLGEFLALAFPLKTSYSISTCLADIFYSISRADREAVLDNLKVVTGGAASADELKSIAREVFRNFAKYLVDFFRFSVIDEEYMKRFVRIEGLENVDKARAAGKGVALATVVTTWGSSPRPVGSQLAIDADGRFAGSVSGGCIEGAVIKEAIDAIATGRPRVLNFGVTNEQAWEVGLACGGKVQVFVERLD